MLPLVNLVTPCYPLLPLVAPFYPVLPLVTLVTLVTPCYPLLLYLHKECDYREHRNLCGI